MANEINDRRASANMGDDDELDAQAAVSEVDLMLAALGVKDSTPPGGRDDDDDDGAVRDDDDLELGEDDEAEDEDDEAGADEEEEEDYSELFDGAAHQIQAVISAQDPQAAFSQVPEELRPFVGNVAQAILNERQRSSQGGFNSGLEAGMRYAELRDLYERDRDTFDELEEKERDLFHELDKHYRGVEAAKKNPPAAPAPDPDLTVRQQAALDLEELKAEHPEVEAAIRAKLAAGDYSKGTALANYRQMQRDIQSAIAAASSDDDDEELTGGPRARRSQRAAKRRKRLPKADVAGGRSDSGTARERLSKFTLERPGAGKSLLEGALAGKFR